MHDADIIIKNILIAIGFIIIVALIQFSELFYKRNKPDAEQPPPPPIKPINKQQRNKPIAIITEEKYETVSFKLHIAIDFGTDGCGLAFAYNDEKENDKVKVYNKWTDTNKKTKKKTKTQLILNQNNKVSCFGNNARQMYCNMSKEGQKGNKFFARFKMALYENNLMIEDGVDGVETSNYLYASNGERVESDIVFIAAFKELQSLAKEFIPRNIFKKGEKIKNEEIQWILTVPAIWSESAKDKMRKWIMNAGLVSKYIIDQCIIVYEPDCASLSIQKAAELEGDLKFEQGETYILVDAGGGTVDIACHKILEDGCVEEVMYPTGNKCGSTYIDDVYIQLLTDIFSKEWIQQFKQIYPANFVQVISCFQQAKETFYKNDCNCETHYIELPNDFMGFLEQECNKINSCPQHLVDEFAQSKSLRYFKTIFFDEYDGKEEEDNNKDFVFKFEKKSEQDQDELDDDEYTEYLVVECKIWKYLFDSKINPIISLVEDLLSRKELTNCKYLGLVGGFSCSKYFQYKMREAFGINSKYKLTVIVPKKPMLCVVEGAAWMGIKKGYIKARKLKQTYGVSVKWSKDKAEKIGLLSEHFIENNLSKNGKFVKNCFKIIARKSDRVSMDEIKQDSFYATKNSKVSKIAILCSDKDLPLTKDEGTVLATLTVRHSIFFKQEKIMTEFHFGGTMVKVYAYPESNPNEKQQISLKYD